MTPLELAKHQLDAIENHRTIAISSVTIQILAKEVIRLSEEVWHREKVIEVYRAETKLKDEALKDAEYVMARYIFRFETYECGACKENRAQLINLKEWLAKHGSKE